MRTLRLLPCLLLLAACSGNTPSLSKNLENPLYAEYYYNDLASTLANIEILKDRKDNAELLKDTAVVDVMHEAKDSATAAAAAARKIRDKAAVGDFIPASESEQGLIMLLGDMFYTGPSFNSPPGPSLHFYISNVLDPREGVFPDPTAIDIGAVEQPYGAAAYPLPSSVKGRYKTVVLYDTVLKRVFGFAQLDYGPDAAN